MTNPNGANQYQTDPRQKLCWESYIDPDSDTFGNGLRSAIKAGYEEDYANQITTVHWFKEKLRQLNLVTKAEKNLEELLDLDIKNGGDKVDAGVARIKADMTKFTAQTLGKDRGYVPKTETDVTSGGLPVTINIVKPE